MHHRQATGDAEIGQRGGDVRAGQRGLKPSKVFSAAGVEFITGGKVDQRKVGLRFLPSLGLVCRPLACELGTGSSAIRRGKHGAAGGSARPTVGLYGVNADRRLNSALPQLVNNKSVAPEGVAITGGAWVSGNTLRRDNRPADHYQRDRISEPEPLENETGKPLWLGHCPPRLGCAMGRSRPDDLVSGIGFAVVPHRSAFTEVSATRLMPP